MRKLRRVRSSQVSPAPSTAAAPASSPGPRALTGGRGGGTPPAELGDTTSLDDRYGVVVTGPWPSAGPPVEEMEPGPRDENRLVDPAVRTHLRADNKARSIWRIPSAR